jgi:DNA-directed RNA polymerase II subunit RPB1
MERKVYRVKTVKERPRLYQTEIKPVCSAPSVHAPKTTQVKALVEEATSGLPEFIIEESRISLLSNEDMEKFDIEINSSDGQGGIGTLSDPRLGATYDTNCGTCFLPYSDCPGHYGRITLPVPIYHPHYLRTLLKVLEVVCQGCGEVKVEDKRRVLETPRSERLDVIKRLGGSCPHPGCGDVPLTFDIKLSTSSHQVILKVRGGNETMDIEKVERILKAITREGWELMGFDPDHKPNFILRYLPVMPPQDRPMIETDDDIREDDITIFYKDILRIVDNIKSLKGIQVPTTKQAEQLKNKINELSNVVFQFMESADGRSYGSRTLRSLKDRIQGKDGFIRRDMMGKRANFTARTVVSPDPTLKFGQVRVPRVFQRNLTTSVVVNQLNIDELNTLLNQGLVTAIVKRNRNRPIYIDDNNRHTIRLQIGDRVSRCLLNGDYVILNRQPTLHKYGMMGHEVVIGEPLTIGIHPSVTTPFNADFDGDEMNLHVVQSTEAKVEVMTLLNVKNCIMNVQNNRPIMAAVYDTLSGTYLLTQPDTRVSRTIYLNAFALQLTSPPDDLSRFEERCRKYDPNSIGKDDVSGKAYFSLLFPPDFYYVKDDVHILEGILVNGVVTKKHIGTAPGSIVQMIWKRYGATRTSFFLTDIARLVNLWLDTRPLSISLYDCLPTDPPQLQDEITKVVAKARLLLLAYGTRLNDPIEEQRREREIIAKLQDVRISATKLAVSSIPKDSTMTVMSLSGAKGGDVNVAQITGLLAQQFLRNQRMPNTLGDGVRCLPWFPQDTLDPTSRGLCVRSFLNGLSPAEFFFHQTASREGLLDTAIRTPESGDLNHRIAKALEDIIVKYDGSVRNSVDTIFQFVYGNDGFNPAEIENFACEYGKQTFFVNVYRVAQELNAKYGYVEETTATYDQTTFSYDVEDIDYELSSEED